MTPTRFNAFLIGMAFCVSVLAGGQSSPAFHRNEIKLSGFSPGLHYEHFFLRRISVDAGVSYSPFNFYPLVPWYPVQREVTKATLSGRLYFGDHEGTQFYWGIYNSYCYQWMHDPNSYENGPYYYYSSIGNGLRLSSLSAGLELGYKMPLRERLTLESNVGVGYNYFYRSYQNDALIATSSGPVLAYGPGINFKMPVDLKMWVSLNYLIGTAK